MPQDSLVRAGSLRATAGPNVNPANIDLLLGLYRAGSF